MNSPVPSPQPSAGNPPPPSRAPDALRDGQYLVVRVRGAQLPAGCVLCNAPEARRNWLKARKFNLPLAGAVLLGSPILIAMYLVSPMAKFEAGLCAAHRDEDERRKRSAKRFLWVVVAIFGLGFIVAAFGPVMEEIAGCLILLSMVLFPIAVAWGIGVRRKFTAVHSDRRYLWVAGVSPDFLQTLPDIAGAGERVENS